MSENNILFGIRDNLCLIKLIGSIKHSISPAFHKLIEKIRQNKNITAIVVDLKEASYIDSTNLGIIARAGEIARQRSNGMTIVCDNEDILMVLESMGFNAVFEIVDSLEDETEPPPLQNAAEKEDKKEKKASIILEAHRTLMNMNEHNRETFRGVVEAFEGEQKDNDHT